MDKTVEVKKLLKEKRTRIALCEKSFKYFLFRYFHSAIKYPKLASYHHDRFKDLQKGVNMYVEGHRESAKTTILGLAYETRKICYSKSRFVCNLCYDKRKARAFNFLLANTLATNPRIKEDFGVLFTRTRKKTTDDEFMTEKGISEFITANHVKVKSFGMGETLRGELYLHPKDGIVRPDHLYVDDIDNDKNTKNRTIIADDIFFLQNEVFGGLDAHAQVIVCGNVIREDGRNPRIKAAYMNNPRRRIHSNFIFGKAGVTSGVPVWERFVLTDEEALQYNYDNPVKDTRRISLEMKKREEMSGFDQNWLGIPKTKGQTVIELNRCKKIKQHELPSEFDYIHIGGDPAFSEKNATDPFGIVVTGFKKINGVLFRYVLRSIKLTGEQKGQTYVDNIFRQLYSQYKARRIIIENNNGGAIFGKSIKKLGLAVDIVTATKDKLTRLKEYEGEFMQGQIFFLEGATDDLVDQLINFTGEDGNEDDLVDAMVRSFKDGGDDIIIIG